MSFKAVQNKGCGVFGRGYYGVILLVSAMLASLLLVTTAEAECAQTERDVRVIRVVVIGGMTREVDLWFAVAQKFEEKTGYLVELVNTGTVDVIAESFEAGEADLLTMHSCDTTTNLVADGYGVNMRPWAHNDLVIMGPKNDPAGIAGKTNGVEALKKIAAAGELGQARFVDLWGIGKRDVCQNLWTKTGIYPVNKPWFVKDYSDSENKQLTYTASLGNAYCLFGRVPVIAKKVSTGGLKILVEGDPAMRRPYIVMEANPKRFPCANYVGARKLSSFLLSKEVQDFLPQYLVDEFLGIPPYHPLRNAAFDSEADGMLQELIDSVILLDLPQSLSHGLEMKLDRALAALNDQIARNNSFAVLCLEAFIQKVEVQKGKGIAADEGDILIAQAAAIIETLQAEDW